MSENNEELMSAPKSNKTKTKDLKQIVSNNNSNNQQYQKSNCKLTSEPLNTQQLDQELNNSFKSISDIQKTRLSSSFQKAAESIISSNKQSHNFKQLSQADNMVQKWCGHSDHQTYINQNNDYPNVRVEPDISRNGVQEMDHIEYVIQQNANAEKIFESTDDDEETNNFFDKRAFTSEEPQMNSNQYEFDNNQHLESQINKKDQSADSDHKNSYKKSFRSERIIFHDEQRPNQRQIKHEKNIIQDLQPKSHKRSKNGNVSRRRSHGPANSVMQTTQNQQNTKKLKVQQQWSVYLQNNPQANIIPCNRNAIRSVGTVQQNSHKQQQELNNQLVDKQNNSVILKQQKPKISQRVQNRILPNSRENLCMLPPIPLTGSNKQYQNRKHNQQSPKNEHCQNTSVWSESNKQSHNKNISSIDELKNQKNTNSNENHHEISRNSEVLNDAIHNEQSGKPEKLQKITQQQSPYIQSSISQKSKPFRKNKEILSPAKLDVSPDSSMRNLNNHVDIHENLQKGIRSAKRHHDDHQIEGLPNEIKSNQMQEFDQQKIVEHVDHQQKNFLRLQALQAKKDQEQKQIELEREKTKRRQEKLKNMILREAEENRKKKAQQDQQKQQEIEQQHETSKQKKQEPLEPEEEERQKKLAMMRRFYRNRHATFIKTLLDQKKKKDETADELKQREERIRIKAKEKAFARLDLQVDEQGRVYRNTDKNIREITDKELQLHYEKQQRLNTGSTILNNQRAQRSASMSINNESKTLVSTQINSKVRDISLSQTPQNTFKSQKDNKEILPTSKEQKKRNIRAAYNISEHEMDQLGFKKKMQRTNSRGSIRSNKSTKSATPIMSRYKSGKHQPGQGSLNKGSTIDELDVMPSLRKQNQNNQQVLITSDAVVYDEEKEQAELEEAKKRRERAKKMREQQEKMLNDLKAKKEAKLKEEENRKKNYEDKLKKAREQVKQNFDKLPEKTDKENELDEFGKKKPPKFTDKTCQQAPDNEPEETSKKEKKPFIEPDLKAFMERNMPKLQVFANITDMKTWKKKHQVDENTKVFIVTGGYGFLKKSLKKRGWIENKDPDSVCFDFKWTLRSKDIDHNALKPGQYVNHFPKASAITTKVGLMHNLKNLIWFNNIDIETFYPRCYDLALTEEQDDFAQEFKAIKAESFIKKYVRELRESAQEGDEIKTTVKEKVLKIAIRVTERRLKDLNEMIDDPKAFEMLVSPEEWKILGGDELNEKKLQKQKYEQRLKQLNMPIPIPKSRGKKRKKFQKKPSEKSLRAQNEADESESDSDEIDDQDEDEAIDKAIAKKFPEFQQCVYLIEELKKNFPQTGINGENNIWIIKPAQSSRGRGIVLMKNLVEIMEIAKQKEFQFIAQKYIETPLIIKARKFDLRVWVIVTDWNPLTIWLFKKPYVRLPAHDYDETDLCNKYSHLANNSIAKYADGKTNQFEIPGNMMFIEEFQEYLIDNYCRDVYEEEIEDKLKTVIINTLESVQDTFEYKRGCFELYGFDIMIDQDFNAWLIEVNSSPAMDYSTHITEKLVKMCLEDTVKVMVDYENAPTAKKKAKVDTGEYELIYKANQAVEKPLNTYGLNLEITGKQIKKHLQKW